MLLSARLGFLSYRNIFQEMKTNVYTIRVTMLYILLVHKEFVSAKMYINMQVYHLILHMICSVVGTKADMVVIFMSIEDVKYSDLCTIF